MNVHCLVFETPGREYHKTIVTLIGAKKVTII